jgi:glycosyltransferase involved in cell wall biosynthesis
MGYSLDIRHIIIEDAGCTHPSEANGVHQVARRIVMEQNRSGDYARIFYVPAANHNDPPANVPVEVIMPTGPAVRGRYFSVDLAETSPLVMAATPDTIFHIHGVRQPLLISLTHGLRRRRLPYAITCHSRYAHIFNRDWQVEHRKTAAYIHFMERPFLEKARFVHALTEVEAEEVRRLAPRASVVTVPNGVFSSGVDGTPPEPALNPWAHGFPVFGFFGRLAVEHKGLDLLVQGFAKYKREGGAGELQIMGTGDEERRQLVKLCSAADVHNHVSLLGPQFGPAKEEILKRWSFFAMPSRFDRMPLAALEAGLLGLPLILTAETGIDVQHYHSGIRIAGLTADAVAAALKTAANLTPDQWRALSLSAYRMVFAIGDWTAITKTLRELYLPPMERAYTRQPEVVAATTPLYSKAEPVGSPAKSR